MGASTEGMNEYETGLFILVGQLMISVLEVGADANRLIRELRINEKNCVAAEKLEAAAMIALCANMIEKARAS